MRHSWMRSLPKSATSQRLMTVFQNHPSPRVYSVRELLADLRWVMTRVKELWSIWVGARLSPALREQVIVAVAQTNLRRGSSWAANLPRHRGRCTGNDSGQSRG